ncbi:DUF4913 domain-containing protein [Nocardia sp. CDC159]|uniref:DUF4913 domain-containing protein n=1 Tax=Nocardia pulmonis TaxID=2951408 RepID=A0A9X2E767_9NOCA|nr:MULTISPECIES: DUF4913 domain-containing protein [Nocardia]MCM6774438.1 DUF4913 domain-containing protein [Nocardia pulmonis]MCM6787496.1 DUF4913 domain-containing protein [Nocardia sp. CDC159]
MTTPAGGGASTKTPKPPAYRDFVDFAEQWLLPFVAVRLAEANREQTYTWCTQWWRHRSVAVRIAHLHSAFEATRRSSAGPAVSTFLLSHVDAHFRWILDAANGPLHRCTRSKHVALQALSGDPIPSEWFGARPASPVGAQPGEQKAMKPRFAHWTAFVTNWLLPVTAVRIAGHQREGQYTWCRHWWAHRAVCIRFAALHAVFEAARRADDPTAMSSLFVSHIDPHLRAVLDAAHGPLHKCTPERHVPLPGLPTSTVAPAWFGVPGATTPVEHLGFGPDFRAFHGHTPT